MWCWRKLEKINCADRVKSEEVLQEVKEERNIIHTQEEEEERITGLVTSCVGTAFFKIPYEGKREGKQGATERRGRRVKQLVDDLKENNRSWNLQKALVSLQRTGCGQGY